MSHSTFIIFDRLRDKLHLFSGTGEERALSLCSSVKNPALSFVILLSSRITRSSRSTFIRSLLDVASVPRSKNPIALKRQARWKISYQRGDSQMDAIFGVILREATTIIIAAMTRRQMVSASRFFAASALVRELERINEWHARPFLCSFAESSTAPLQKTTRGEADFWRGSIGHDNAHNDLFISRIFCRANACECGEICDDLVESLFRKMTRILKPRDIYLTNFCPVDSIARKIRQVRARIRAGHDLTLNDHHFCPLR